MPAATWVRTFAKKSFQSVPLIAEISNVMPGSNLVISGWSRFCSSSAADCSPKYSILSVFDDEPPLLLHAVVAALTSAARLRPAAPLSRLRRPKLSWG